jgi:hypothetical protein
MDKKRSSSADPLNKGLHRRLNKRLLDGTEERPFQRPWIMVANKATI